MKKRYLVLGLSLLMLFSALNVSAAEFIAPGKNGGSVIINKESENVYTAGNVIFINSNIKKGLFASGNTINLDANIEGTFCAAGGTIITKGNVGGTMYAGGGSIFIGGKIGDDLFIGGGDATLAENSSVGGDLIAGTRKITINGPIGGNVLLGAGEAIINSKISGSVKASADKLELGDNAQISGNLEYTSKEKIEIDKSKVLGEVIFHQKETAKPELFRKPKMLIGLLTLGLFLKFLGAIAIGLLLAYLFKKLTADIVKESLQKFWHSLGVGFGALVLTPIACVILAVLVIGLWPAGIIGAIYVLMLGLSLIFSGIIFGAWLIKIITKKKEYVVDWKAVVVGVIAMKILIFVPVLGWFARFIFFLIALGAVIKWFYGKLKGEVR